MNKPCNCSENRKNTVFYRASWANGVTDIQVRRLSKTTYLVIDHCCEHKTADGTGLKEKVTGAYEAHRLARQFASFLKSYKIPCA